MASVRARIVRPAGGSPGGGGPRGGGGSLCRNGGSAAMALPRALRFRRRHDVLAVLSRGRRVDTPLGRVSVRRLPAGRGRILFVVPAAVAKRSTTRHRIKRQLDAWVLGGGLGALGRFDIVVRVDRSAASASGRALRALAEGMRLALVRALTR